MKGARVEVLTVEFNEEARAEELVQEPAENARRRAHGELVQEAHCGAHEDLGDEARVEELTRELNGEARTGGLI